MQRVRRSAARTRRLRHARVAPEARRASGAARIVRFRMASRRSAVAPAVERVLSIVRDAGLSEDQVHDLAVAVAEALSNAAVHGNALRPEAMVNVVVEVTPRRQAVVDVKDSGQGFDFSALSDPTDPSRILIPGGRGVFLMRRLVDALEFSDAGSRVRLMMVRH
jgi:anti-sigma regulatory factor (Ser/Thr protein kinase)